VKAEDAHPPHLQFNFAMGLIHGILFQAGMAFSEPMSVLPVFLEHFTSSRTMIGVFSALISGGGVFPQLFVANKVERRARKKPVLLWAIWARMACWGILAGITYFWIGSKDPLVLLIAFIVLLFTFSFCGGVASIPFFDIWSKAIPPTLRGRFFGHRQFWGGLMAVVAGYVVKRILGNTNSTFPKNYALLFSLSFIFIGLSYVGLSSVREPEGEPNPEKRNFRSFLSESVRILWKDKNFGWFMLAQLAASFGSLAMPFYVLYATTELGIPIEQVGIFVAARMVGAITSNLLWAQLSDRIGNRIVIVLCTVSGTLVPLLAILTPSVGHGLMMMVFVLVGFSISGGVIGFKNYLLEIAPEPSRPAYLSLHGTLSGATMFLPILGGVIADAFSYRTVFVSALAVLTAAFLLSLKLKAVRKV
jgi:MFS family permease